MNSFEFMGKFRSPEEIAQDKDRERHLDGYCDGAPDCWLCQEEKDRTLEEIQKSTVAKLDATIDLFKAMQPAFDKMFRG